MSSTFKRAIGFAVTFFMSLGFVAASASSASALPDKVTLTVHYNRTAGDYENWNLFLWRNLDGAGDKTVSEAGFNFTTEDDFGVAATAVVDGMATFKDLGFIIRKGAWVAKEGPSCGPTNNGDRFASFSNAGVAEIWIKQGDCTIYTEAPKVEAPAPAIVSASIDDLDKISVVLNQQFIPVPNSANGFTLTGGLTVTSVALKGGNGTSSSMLTLTLSDEITFGTTYTLTHTGADADSTYGSKVASVGNVMNSDGFNAAFKYDGNDLGATYTKASTTFRVWAPTASDVKLAMFASPTSASADATQIQMVKGLKGTWVVTVNGDQKGKIYGYRVTRDGETVSVIDPYARASTINGGRGVIVDLDATDPTNWSKTKPAFSGRNVDAFFYELHVRDFSINPSSGVSFKNRGKFTAFTETNTSYSWSVTTTDSKTKKKITKKYSTKTGLAAIKDLGVTHVQLLPIYDFASGGDEAKPVFNWGYDPDNYNIPEGQYSTDPTTPTKRITELKQAVQAMHSNKLRVIMDVVYNHVANPNNFSYEQIVPGYFFRKDDSGGFLNGTGVGNETASERAMFSKFIVDSVKYWATEYNLDGFRFDLMGIHDVTTMQKVRAELNKIDPSIIVIGEGWNMGALPEDQRATQINIGKMKGIAAFNDQIRDGIKGSVFNADEQGWATGNTGRRNDVRAGITGNVAYSAAVTANWITSDPGQSVSYVEAHDNLTLADKLFSSVKTTSTTRSKLHRFASSISILAQGLPFIHAGQEFERTKGGDDNSYQSSDTVNSMKYKQRVTYATTLNYFKGLISLRKAHPAFRMATTSDVKKNLTFLNTSQTVIAYKLNGAAVRDKWGTIVVVHNAGKSTASVTMPGGKATWKVVVNGDKAGVATLATLKSVTKISVPAGTTMVLYK
jgi:pullulanase